MKTKTIKKSMLALGTVAAIAAPIASVVACGSDDTVAVGLIVTPDGTINDGFFGPLYKAVQGAAKTAGESSNYIDVSGKETKNQIDSANTLIENGAKIIYQPGFMNSASLIDNAVAHKDAKFIGVAYTKFVASTKAFSDGDHQAANMAKFNSAKNIGLIHFRTQEQGFMMGYLAAATYLRKNTSATEIKYSEVSSKAYQDTTAMMDGYIAGVKALTTKKGKTATLVTPKGGFYTDITIENNSFHNKMQLVEQDIKKQGANIVLTADPNCLPDFNGKGFLLSADGQNYGANYKDVVVATNKDWSLIFNKATSIALKDDAKFISDYHDQMHLSSFDNKELILEKDHQYLPAEKIEADSARKAWEQTLTTASVKAIYTKADSKGNESGADTSKGMIWINDLA